MNNQQRGTSFLRQRQRIEDRPDAARIQDRIELLIQKAPRTIEQLSVVMGIPFSTMGRHLRDMTDAGRLVQVAGRKFGRGSAPITYTIAAKAELPTMGATARAAVRPTGTIAPAISE